MVMVYHHNALSEKACYGLQRDVPFRKEREQELKKGKKQANE
jgi:hypothetical protein